MDSVKDDIIMMDSKMIMSEIIEIVEKRLNDISDSCKVDIDIVKKEFVKIKKRFSPKK